MHSHSALGLTGVPEYRNLPSPSTSTQSYSPASQTQSLAVDPQYVTKRKTIFDTDDTPGKRRRDDTEDSMDAINTQKHWTEDEKNSAVSSVHPLKWLSSDRELSFQVYLADGTWERCKLE